MPDLTTATAAVMAAGSRTTVAAKSVESRIADQVSALGVAEVLVILRRPTAAGAVITSAKSQVSDLKSYFQRSNYSQLSMMAKASAGPSIRRAAPRRSRVVEPVISYPHLGVLLGTVTSDGFNDLQKHDAVAAISVPPQISLIRPTRAVSASLTKTATWGIEALNVPRLWKEGLSGKNVRVAHLDTGVDGKHPALKKAIAQFAEFDYSGKRIAPNPSPYDSGEHGTHTAGTIAGREVQGKHIGVAPQAELYSAMVIEGGQVIARVLGGMDWAVENKVKVLSMSLGIRGYLEDFLPLIQILRENGVLPVIAVGNEGVGTSRSPGNYDIVLSVGAMDETHHVTDFSSSQHFDRPLDPVVPDLVAPGSNVISAQPQNRYQALDGTSMATPHVAGLAALLCEAKPTASVAEVETAIFDSCVRDASMDPDRANRGVPDAIAALQKLTGVTLNGSRRSKGRPSAKKKTRKH